MIESYFTAEKKAGFIALAIGLLACTIASTIFISAMPPFYMGHSVAFIAIGILEIIVGSTLARNSDFQALDLQKIFGTDPKAFEQLESPRMEKVMRRVRIYQSLGLLTILVCSIFLLWKQENNFFTGLANGLLVQAPFVWAFGFFAEKRAKKYKNFLNGLLEGGQ